MAAALSPAYVRIAGPSTSGMDFRNTSLLLNDTKDSRTNEVSPMHRGDADWTRFAEWVKLYGFELVFALDSDERNAAGRWDPNEALNILSIAHEAKIENIVWQLGYECRNSTADEYLEDLETLRVMVHTFPAGRSGGWRVVAGDVTACLTHDSGRDFSDYVTASSDLLDAVFLNGNSSATELDKMKESERKLLLEFLSNSATPLWITETRDDYSELERAVDWLTSLGFSARNGFDVHFRELQEHELNEPSLSFYMSLLFKNLVGSRVLDVATQDTATNGASLFAHCTSLKRQDIPGAITLFGSNVDDQLVRFSVNLSKREEGGDIMQFIISQDINGNTIVNGHPMIYDGDIKPVVKRIRPYKTLLITLPPKSFGFWVLANTKIEACGDIKSNNSNPQFMPATLVEDIRDKMAFAHSDFKIRTRRETSLIRNDVILHKLIGDNQLSKEKYISSESEEGKDITLNAFEELDQLTENVNDLQKTLAEIKRIVNIDNFYENVLFKTRDEYDTELGEESVINRQHRQKRQTIGENLKAAVEKLKSSVNKPINQFKAKNIHTDSNVPLKLTKVKEENKNIRSRGITESKMDTDNKDKNIEVGTKDLLKKTKVRFEEIKPINQYKAKKLNTNSNVPSKLTKVIDETKKNAFKDITESKTDMNDHKDKNIEVKSKDILKKTKDRFKELRNRISAKQSQASEQIIKLKGLKLEKRSTSANDVPKISKNLKHLGMKKANALTLRNGDYSLHRYMHIQKPKPVYERRKRSTKGLKETRNSIIDLANPFADKINKIVDKSILNNILNQIEDDVDIPPLIEISNIKNSDNDILNQREKESNNILKSKNNDISKDQFNELDSDVFEDQILLKSKISDEDASIMIDEKSNKNSVLKRALDSVSSWLDNLKNNFTRILKLLPNFP